MAFLEEMLGMGGPVPGGIDGPGGSSVFRGNPNAIGNLLSPLSGIGSNSVKDSTSERGIMDLLNKQKLGLQGFLARGGGADNAEQAFRNLRKNNLLMETPGSGAFLEANPDMMAAMQARAHRGPGGGLGVFSGVQDFVKENDPGLEFMKEPGFLRKLLGGAARVGGAIFAPMTGGGSLVAGNIAGDAITGGGNRRKFEIR